MQGAACPPRRTWKRERRDSAKTAYRRSQAPSKHAELERRPPPVLPVGARHTGPPSGARRAFRMAQSPLGRFGLHRYSARSEEAPLQPSRIGAPTSASPPGGGAAHWSAERSAASVSHSAERRPPPVLPVGARHTGPPSAARRPFRMAQSPPGTAPLPWKSITERGTGLTTRHLFGRDWPFRPPPADDADRRSALPCRARFGHVWTTSLLCLGGTGRLGGVRSWWRPRLVGVVRVGESVSFARLRRAMPVFMKTGAPTPVGRFRDGGGLATPQKTNGSEP